MSFRLSLIIPFLTDSSYASLVDVYKNFVDVDEILLDLHQNLMDFHKM